MPIDIATRICHTFYKLNKSKPKLNETKLEFKRIHRKLTHCVSLIEKLSLYMTMGNISLSSFFNPNSALKRQQQA